MRQRKSAHIVDDKDRLENPNAFEQDKSTTSSSGLTFSSRRIFVTCLALRMANSLLVQTYFNPDEHWQALEVAHRITFGYGHLTWEWKKGIRSYLHPMVFAFLYKILALFHLDTPLFMGEDSEIIVLHGVGEVVILVESDVSKVSVKAQATNWKSSGQHTKSLIKAPRLLQSLFAAVGDLYVYKLSHVLFGGHVAQWALLLVKFPRVSRKWGLVVAALACAIRPTSAITWAYVGLLELLVACDRLKFIFLEVVPVGVLVLTLAWSLDRLMYGSWVLVPLNFLKFNFLSSGGDYYGTHKWHWYFTQGFSVMLFTFLPFFIAGIILSKQWKLSGLIAWVLGLYSVLGHKEFRFVLPVLPIALMFSGYSLATIGRSDSPHNRRKGSPSIHTKCPSKKHWVIIFLFATNLPMALYMSLVHQRGTEDVMNYLSKEARNEKVESILFLTPCHATPYYSTLHRNLPMRFLDCSPSEEKGVLDESDRFMMDPVGFASEFAKNWSLPSHIVLFDSQEKLLKDFLTSHSFQEKRRFFHAHFKVDRDLQASVVVYAFKGQ
ncbi:hypothetical protein HYC85_003901 [Camellia sinensis]|uniref:Mannosyltransferase n=1 Tax=Camellia sinensis TaxID=4442 RepID=A0A7J7HX36_CAMSI|nr:hypothetical protein HYC85_003901 [Camellia sinensis]